MKETQNKIERKCPICNKALMHEHKIKYHDYHCFPPADDHHFAERIKDDEQILIKVRVCKNKEKIFFKVNFAEKFSEFWTLPDDRNRIKIDSVIHPDFSNLTSLYDKIKTYLVFA